MLRAVFLVLFLTGCAREPELVRVPEGAKITTTRAIYFATSRQRDGQGFGPKRSKSLTYGLAEVSIPATHRVGKIEWPNRQPDTEQHFLLSDAQTYPSQKQFRTQINAALNARPPENRDVVIFIHGFNSSFPESLYRMAQMTHDLDIPAVAVHYAWPSSGHTMGYAYDRDSALFARDGLHDLIQQISLTNARRIVIIAHSLGSLVTMETMRQIRHSHEDKLLNRIGGVILMSPDIDIDVFRAQADQIGQLPDPFIIFSSQNDHALKLVERLTGQDNRLGKLDDVSLIAEYNVTYVDISAFDDGDGLNHTTLATSPALLAILGQLEEFDLAMATDKGSRAGFWPGTVLTIQNVSNVILKPVPK